MIETLSPLAGNAGRREKVVARCHARLAQQRRKLERRKNVSIERGLLTGFALAYFAAVAVRALSVFTMF